MKNPNVLKIRLLVLLTLYSLHAFAQVPDWLWAESAGGSNDDLAYTIAVDGSGNSYVTGRFEGASITFGSTTLFNTGAADMFIVKYNASGNVVWAKNAGGGGADYGAGIAVDGSGNSYVAGSFAGASITFDTITLNGAGFDDFFIVKYDINGNAVWAKSAGDSWNDWGADIAVDVNSNIYVTGYFRSPSITFGATTLTNTSVGGFLDIFIVKYDASGHVVWAKKEGGNDLDYSTAIAVDGSGNSYVTGWFESPSITFGSTTLTQAGNGDVFIVKYDASGNVRWAVSAGGSGHDYGRGIAVDGSGNSLISGSFTSPSITFGSTTLTNAGGFTPEDVFVVKYDSSGNALWAKSAGGVGYDGAGCIAVDGSGNSYATGRFDDPSITFGSTTLANAGTWDVFIVKYDANGNVVWAKSAGGSGDDGGSGIAVDGSGNCYLTGSFQSSSISFGSTTLTNTGGHDIFVAKLDAPPNSIEDVSATGAWTAYPNPVKDILYLRSSNDKTHLGLAQVYDCTGRKVLEKMFDGKQAEINMQHLPTGLYWMRMGAEGVKVVKE